MARAPKVNLIQPYGILAFANLDVMVYANLGVSNVSEEMAIVIRNRELRVILFL